MQSKEKHLEKMELEHLLYAVDNHVATITLNRPETLNALTPGMRTSLLSAITASTQL